MFHSKVNICNMNKTQKIDQPEILAAKIFWFRDENTDNLAPFLDKNLELKRRIKVWFPFFLVTGIYYEKLKTTLVLMFNGHQELEKNVVWTLLSILHSFFVAALLKTACVASSLSNVCCCIIHNSCVSNLWPLNCERPFAHRGGKLRDIFEGENKHLCL